ncbi:hypothetical protein [Holophaga foetida]|nr:hypothetical protein [Holophaga foetida]
MGFSIGLGLLAGHAGLRTAFLTRGLLHAVPLNLFLVFDRVWTATRA